jgi:hypothetical protein
VGGPEISSANPQKHKKSHKKTTLRTVLRQVVPVL